MLSCCKEDNCSQFNVSAKGFFSLYKEKMETRAGMKRSEVNWGSP